MLQNPNFPGLRAGSRWELTALPRPLADGEGARCPSQDPPKKPTLALGHSGLVSTGLRVYNPLQSW